MVDGLLRLLSLSLSGALLTGGTALLARLLRWRMRTRLPGPPARLGPLPVRASRARKALRPSRRSKPERGRADV